MISEGWVCWKPPKVKFYKTDILGCWDIICVGGTKRDEIKLIQFTTSPNASSHRKKIKKFLLDNDLHIESELWGYNKKKKKWKVEVL